MRPELSAIEDELSAADGRLRRLLDATPEDRWTRQPEPGRWSIMECVDHLNLSTDAYRESIPAAIDEARALPPHDERRRYRRDPIGWLIWRSMGPPVRFGRSKTGERFEPKQLAPPAEVVHRFFTSNDEVRRWIRDCDGLAVDKVMIRSPFVERVRYNAFATLAIIARHQHRHLWQAEQAARTLR